MAFNRDEMGSIIRSSGITVFGIDEAGYSIVIHEADAIKGLDAMGKPGGITQRFGGAWILKLRPDSEIIFADGTFQSPPPAVDTVLHNYGVDKYRIETFEEPTEKITVAEHHEPSLLTALTALKVLYPAKNWKYSLVSPESILRTFGAEASETEGSDITVGEAFEAAEAALADLQFFYPAIAWTIQRITAEEVITKVLGAGMFTLESNRLKYRASVSYLMQKLKNRLQKLFPSVSWTYEEIA